MSFPTKYQEPNLGASPTFSPHKRPKKFLEDLFWGMKELNVRCVCVCGGAGFQLVAKADQLPEFRWLNLDM